MSAQTSQRSTSGMSAILADYRARIRRAEMPWRIRKEAVRQLRRLASLPKGSFEHYMVRGYLEAVIEVQWAERAATERRVLEALLASDERPMR